MERKTRRKVSFKRRLTYVFAIFCILLFLGLAYHLMFESRSDVDKLIQFKGAIIDQLFNTNINVTFSWTARNILTDGGFQPHYFEGGSPNDNVNFYRSLPEQGFKVIVLRAHSALNPATGDLAIFTSEGWDDERALTTYLADILADRLAKVRVTENSTAYFGITYKFVRAMQGDFNGAVVIMMGCDGMADKNMVEAFIEKGASVVIGWTGPVDAGHTDAATAVLLRLFVSEKYTVSQSVRETLAEVGEDPYYGSSLDYYPATAANSTIDEIKGISSR